MFLPIGDSPNLPKTPWLTWALIAANVAIFLMLLPLGSVPANPSHPEYLRYLQVVGAPSRAVQVPALDFVHFVYGAKPRDLTFADALTSMFLHGGLMHIAGNMLFLWIFGDNVEHRLGRWRFLLAYLGTGFAAVLGDTVLRWGSLVPSIGASGAISGILGLYFAWFPRNRVRVWAFLFPFYIGTVELPARIVLGMYLVLDNILPLLLTGGEGGGVSYGAHVGGFVAGWSLARWLEAHPSPGRPRAPRPGGPREAVLEPRTLREGFRAALAAGRLEEAAELFFGQPRRRTLAELTAGDKTALGEALERLGEPRAALAAYQRALADHPTSPLRAAAHLGAARVLLRLRAPTSAYQHLYAVLEEEATPAEEAVARQLLAELRGEARTVPRRFLDGGGHGR